MWPSRPVAAACSHTAPGNFERGVTLGAVGDERRRERELLRGDAAGGALERFAADFEGFGGGYWCTEACRRPAPESKRQRRPRASASSAGGAVVETLVVVDQRLASARR